MSESGRDRSGIEWRCVKSWTREDFPSDDLAKDLPLIDELLDACAEDYAIMEEKGQTDYPIMEEKGQTDYPIKLMKYIGEGGEIDG